MAVKVWVLEFVKIINERYHPIDIDIYVYIWHHSHQNRKPILN